MSTYNLKDKVAIVTGAGSGIGHVLAELLLQAGCSVVFADLSLRPEAARTVQEYHLPIEKKGPATLFHKTDVTDWTQLTDLWETTIETFGQIDIVANVAGIFDPPSSNFWKLPGIAPEAGDKADASPGSYKTISINYIAPVRLAQMAIDYWCRNTHVKGNFIAVSSMAAYMHSMENPLYTSSKAGLVSFIKSVGGLNDHLGIRISAVCPGVVDVSARLLFINFLVKPTDCGIREQTPLLRDKFGENPEDDGSSLTPRDCAEVIFRVLQESQWGRGSIVETSKVLTEHGSEVVVRDVPLEILYPASTSFGGLGSTIAEREGQLISQLQEKGNSRSFL